MAKVFFVFVLALILTQMVLRRNGVERSLLIKAFFNVLIVLLLGTSVGNVTYSLVNFSFLLLLGGFFLSILVLSSEEERGSVE